MNLLTHKIIMHLNKSFIHRSDSPSGWQFIGNGLRVCNTKTSKRRKEVNYVKYAGPVLDNERAAKT